MAASLRRPGRSAAGWLKNAWRMWYGMRKFFWWKLACAMPGMTANCLSGFGRRGKNSSRSSRLAMPSYWPRMMIVGAVIARDRPPAGWRTCRRRCRSAPSRRGRGSRPAKASITSSSAVPGWSRAKMLRTKARSIGRRFFDRNSGRRLRRSASVGLPSPVHTKASRARRWTRSGWRWANSAARRAPDEMPYVRKALDAARAGDVVGRGLEVVGADGDVGVDVAMLVRPPVALHVDAPGVVAEAREVVHRRGVGAPGHLEVEGRLGGHRRAVDEQDRPSRRRASRRRPSPRGTGAPGPCGSSARARERRARRSSGSSFLRVPSPWRLGGHFSLRTRCRRGSRRRPAAPGRPRRRLRIGLDADARAVVQHHVAVDEVAEERHLGDLARAGSPRARPRPGPSRRQPEALGADRDLDASAPAATPAARATRTGSPPATETRLSSAAARTTRAGSRFTRPMKSATVAAGRPRVDLARRARPGGARPRASPRSGRTAPSPPPGRG